MLKNNVKNIWKLAIIVLYLFNKSRTTSTVQTFFIKMITEILTYFCVSALLMTVKVHLDGEEFFSKQLQIARKKREELKQKLLQRKISPMVYKNELERYTAKSTISTTLCVNYILSPVIAPLILLTFIFRILSDTIFLINFRW